MHIYYFALDITIKGGTEGITVSLANLFVEKGHKVSIISFFKSNPEIGSKLDERVNVIYLNEKAYPLENGYVARFKSFVGCYRKLRRLAKTSLRPTKGNVYIGQNFFPNMLLWLVGLGKYAIGCEHFKYDIYPTPIAAIRNFVYARFGRIVTLTDVDAAKFKNHIGESRVVTIPNMVTVKTDFELDMNSKIIIAVGRLQPQKGFDFLIKAMRTVIDKHSDWILNIWGIGDLHDELQNQINNLNLQQHVFLKGFTHDIVSEYAKSSFFVLSSRYEGFPLALIEALSLGIPSVAFNCPSGCEELLANGGGILVEKENVEKLTEAIIYMIEHPQYRLECSKHKEQIRKELSPDVIYDKWHQLFLSMNK